MAATCRSCRAPIIWAVSAKTGKPMPLDYARVDEGVRWQPDAENVARQCSGRELGHVSHFATCPDAVRHRRKT